MKEYQIPKPDKSIMSRESNERQRKVLASLTQDERQTYEIYLSSLGADKAYALAKSVPHSALVHLEENFNFKADAKLAISRWNFIENTIRWSALMMFVFSGAGALFGLLLAKHNWFVSIDLLKVIGKIGVNVSFFAGVFGACFNIYDAARFPVAVKKITERLKELLSFSKNEEEIAANAEDDSNELE